MSGRKEVIDMNTTQSQKSRHSRANLYSRGTVMRELFAATPKYRPREEVIGEVSKATGKDRKHVRWSYTMVCSSKHVSNHGRSTCLRRKPDLIKFVAAK
jgi:hypothetical protein